MSDTVLANDDLPPKPKSFTLTVRRCPWCRATHVALVFLPLAHKTREGHTHGAPCRVTGRQILAKREK